MKAVMISIKPKYVAKILNGEKTIEIRKTMPKCELPIDVYIYCTKGNEQAYLEGTKIVPNVFKSSLHLKEKRLLNGKVVAKFTLNKVEEIMAKSLCQAVDEERILEKSCLSHNELFNYLTTIDFEKGKHKPLLGYAWHIDNLEIFEEPKELSEFTAYRWNEVLDENGMYVIDHNFIYKPLTKPFQSWGYVEVDKK